MSAERELEQLRQSFAVERSHLENTIAKLRRQLDEACSGEKERADLARREYFREKAPAPPPTLPPVERFERRLGDYCPSPVEPPAPRQPILRCSRCDSQVGPSHWSRDGERRCEKCGPFEPRSTGRCETCGTAKLVADDECSWCGPGAHKP